MNVLETFLSGCLTRGASDGIMVHHKGEVLEEGLTLSVEVSAGRVLHQGKGVERIADVCHLLLLGYQALHLGTTAEVSTPELRLVSH